MKSKVTRVYSTWQDLTASSLHPRILPITVHRGEDGQLIFCCQRTPSAVKMIALFNKLLDWFKALFWKEEMELTLVGLQYSGKTTFVNVIAVNLIVVILCVQESARLE